MVRGKDAGLWTLELCQLDQIYLTDLAGYNHIVNQRNKLLKDMYHNPALKDTLEIWDLQMLQYGQKVISKRKEFVKDLNDSHKGNPQQPDRGRGTY